MIFKLNHHFKVDKMYRKLDPRLNFISMPKVLFIRIWRNLIGFNTSSFLTYRRSMIFFDCADMEAAYSRLVGIKV